MADVENPPDLSQRILRAAKQLFFARGFANTSLRAIASEAGTSESGILRIYRSKAGLLRAVYASCWTELNARIDKAMTSAAQRDPDPRNLLLELIRTVLEGYEADPPKMQFMLSHFGFRDTTGLAPLVDVDPNIDGQVREEYHRYLDRVHDLCAAIVRDHPRLSDGSVSLAALGHFAISIIYGIQTSWYMADQEELAAETVATREEVLTAVRFFLYPDVADVCPAFQEGPDAGRSGVQRREDRR